MIHTSTNTNANIHIKQQTQEASASRKEEVKAIEDEYQASKEKNFAQLISSVQSIVEAKSSGKSFEVQYEEFQTFLKDIGYDGKPIAELSQSEAAELVSEDGFFGVQQTSERIAQFVILGSGGNEELLRAGREGVLQGFKDAEAVWGGKLPDIAYETIQKAVEMIDQALIEGGFSVMDQKV